MYVANTPSVVFVQAPVSPVQTFVVFSSNGSVIRQYLTQRMITVVTCRGVLFLKNDKYFQKWDASKMQWEPERERTVAGQPDKTETHYLWEWDGKSHEPKCVAKIRWETLPPFHKIRAIAEIEAGLTLILDDDRFIFLKYEDKYGV